jgi:hypothetical protein
MGDPVRKEAGGKCACCGELTPCRFCGEAEDTGYWCDVCGREVASKRCPLCGLKARKIREKGERR